MKRLPNSPDESDESFADDPDAKESYEYLDEEAGMASALTEIFNTQFRQSANQAIVHAWALVGEVFSHDSVKQNQLRVDEIMNVVAVQHAIARGSEPF